MAHYTQSNDIAEINRRLERSERLLADVQRLSKTGGWEYDIDADSMFWTDELYALHGFNKPYTDNLIASSLNCYPESVREKILNAFILCKNEGINYDMVVPFTDRQGNRKWVRTKSWVVLDPDGKPAKVVGSVRDVTEEVTAENRIIAALKEKEIMLAEIHHRVKNNLTIMSGLLQLQAMSNENPEITQALNISVDRINAMAMVHEMLYESEEFSYIRLNEYIKRLTNKIAADYDQGHLTRVKKQLDLRPIHIEITQAIPLGLLLNEIISNAYKHGLANMEEGILRIELLEVDDACRITVSDNGPGFRQTDRQLLSGNLGMHLIKTLSDQLGASVDVTSTQGTHYVITLAR